MIAQPPEPQPARLHLTLGGPSPAVLLAGAVAASCVLRIVLAFTVRGPWIFPDELGYQQLAVNLAHGRLALYGESGLSYSPLYPLTLSPLFAAGLSATHAYRAITLINALLMSLALVPAYGIARFLLPRRESLGVVVLAALAPLMYLTSLGMSENLAYPLFLVACWLLLRTLAEPSRRNDAFVLGAVVLACGARIQLAALLPAVATAPFLLALPDVLRRRKGLWETVPRTVREHEVLIGGSVLLALVAVATSGAFSVAGRYSDVPGSGSTSPIQLAKLFVYHAAGLVFVAGVLPFIGTLAIAVLWPRHGRPDSRTSAFAAAGLALAFWLLVETAIAEQAFQHNNDAPRIHERYLFYLVPFFLTAILVGLRRGVPRVAYVVATVLSAAAVAVIPFQTVINGTVVADSFSFEVFARSGTLQAVSHATLLALAITAVGGALLVALRRRPAFVVAAVAIVFVLMSYREGTRVVNAANGHRAFLTTRDWVDRAHRSGVAMVVGPATTDPVAEWQTDYYNLSITRLYYTCQRTLSPDFGERRVRVARDGAVTAGGRPLGVAYAVVPAGLGVEGRVLARDRKSRQELVATDGSLRVDTADRARWACRRR
jgi:Dolichyl-phosphate-mannose-protein mannosyltransferase